MITDLTKRFEELGLAMGSMGCSLAEAVKAIAAAWNQMATDADKHGKVLKENSNRLTGTHTNDSKGHLEIFEPNIEETKLTLDNYDIEIEEFKDWMMEI